MNSIRHQFPSWVMSSPWERSEWTHRRFLLEQSGRFPHHKHVLCFLGFVNFYCKFLRNLGSIATLLHAVRSNKTKYLWTPQADHAFQQLKECFTSVPVLFLPDPNLQIVVVVDASETGVGAVPLQRGVPLMASCFSVKETHQRKDIMTLATENY